MKIKMTSKDGVTLLTKGKYCAEDIEVTPTFEMGGESAEVVTKYAYSGTAVPNTGTISDVYWNTSLTMEEVNTLIQDANLTWADFDGRPAAVYPIYAVFADGAPTSLVMIINGQEAFNSSGYVIMDMMSQAIILVSSAELGEITGSPSDWDATLISNQGIVAVNGELQSSLADMGLSSVGAENSKLVSLISATEFTKEVAEGIHLSGTYDGTPFNITENGEYNVRDLLAIKRLPLDVNVNVKSVTEVSTATGMSSVLANATSADNGKVYKYTGATTEDYTQGAYYLLEV